MFVVHMKDTEFVIVKYDDYNNPVEYLQNIVVRFDDEHSGLYFAKNVKSAYRFSKFEKVMRVFNNIIKVFDSEYCEKLTIARIYGEDELLCLYN